MNLTGGKTELSLAKPLQRYEAQPSVRALGEFAEPAALASEGESAPDR